MASEAEARAWIGRLPQADAAAMARLEALAAMLGEENARQNLVSASSLDAVWVRHFADSAQLVALADGAGTGPWLDLGTGAGFPGLVVGALCPQREVWLAESRPRRCEWLERARSALGLDRVVVLADRLERMETRTAAVISARAFAPLPRLVALSARFSTSDTLWLLPKGRSAQQELEALRGWRHTFHVEHSSTDPDAGIIVGHVIARKGTNA